MDDCPGEVNRRCPTASNGVSQWELVSQWEETALQIPNKNPNGTDAVS